MNTIPRRLALVAAGIITALSLAACQPTATFGDPVPPKSALTVQGEKDAVIFVQWTFDNTHCRYSLSVLEDGHGLAFSTSGGPAVGSTFVVPKRDNTFHVWITPTPNPGYKGKCTSKVTAIPSPTS